MNPVTDPIYSIVNSQDCVEGYYAERESAEKRAESLKGKPYRIVEYTPKVVTVIESHE